MSDTAQTALAFNARRLATMGETETLFRVYFASGGLFFIKVGGDTNTTAAYLVGGVIGLLIARAMNNNKKKVQEKVVDMDQRSLRDRMEDSPSNFRVRFDQIEWAKIEPTSFLTSQTKNVGRLSIKFEDKKFKRIFELPEVEDMRVALAELPKALGPDRLKIAVEWNPKKNKYVKLRKPKQDRQALEA